MSTYASKAKGRWRWMAVVLVSGVIALTGLVLWFGEFRPGKRDPVFRGKPESQWIKSLKYSDSGQVEQWRAYGDEGVQVLIRGLQEAGRTGRAYRKFNGRLPGFLRHCLPEPKPDSTASTRLCITSLLWGLGNDARSAVAVMIWTANNDESATVRQMAIGYFNYNGAENCPLNQLPPRQKEALLPAYLRAIQDPSNAGMRHNASIGIKYFPDHREKVIPALMKALHDSDPHVCIYSAEALNRIAPDVAQKAGAMSVLVGYLKTPDAPAAAKAVGALGHVGSRPEVAVPALIAFLQGTNTLLACEAVWALEWAPKEFDPFAEAIIDGLGVVAERKDSVGGYARTALARWKSKADGKRK